MLEVRNEIHVFEGMLNWIRKRFVTSLYKGSAIEVLPKVFLPNSCAKQSTAVFFCVYLQSFKGSLTKRK